MNATVMATIVAFGSIPPPAASAITFAPPLSIAAEPIVKNTSAKTMYSPPIQRP
jgi:hypothetical protein